MRKSLLVFGIVLSAILAAPVAGAAANSSAHIVSCSTATACYSPNPIRITVGSTVTWTNDHSLAHTATADSGAWDTGALATGAASSPIPFNTPGTFPYHCRFHADMHGSVIVSAAAAATPAPAATPRMGSLARTGGGPGLPLGAGLAFLGLLLLAAGGLRRKHLQR